MLSPNLAILRYKNLRFLGTTFFSQQIHTSMIFFVSQHVDVVFSDQTQMETWAWRASEIRRRDEDEQKKLMHEKSGGNTLSVEDQSAIMLTFFHSYVQEFGSVPEDERAQLWERFCDFRGMALFRRMRKEKDLVEGRRVIQDFYSPERPSREGPSINSGNLENFLIFLRSYLAEGGQSIKKLAFRPPSRQELLAVGSA